MDWPHPYVPATAHSTWRRGYVVGCRGGIQAHGRICALRLLSLVRLPQRRVDLDPRLHGSAAGFAALR
jgi:hypothetical protein